MSSRSRRGSTSKRLRGVEESSAFPSTGDGAAIDLTQPASAPGSSGGGPRLGVISMESAMRVVETVEQYEDAVKRLERNLAAHSTCTDHQLDAVARSTVRFVLFWNSHKEGSIVSRAEVMKHIGEHLVAQKRGVSELILAKAQLLLASCFGLDMKELVKPATRKGLVAMPTQQQGGEGEVVGGTKYMVLKSMVPKELYKKTVGKTDSTCEDARRGLLGVILALITMSGGILVEEELWRHLRMLGVDKAVKHSMLEGIPCDIVDDFVRKRYLRVEKQPGVDDDTRSYMVAENALSEVSDSDILSHIQGELARDLSAP